MMTTLQASCMTILQVAAGVSYDQARSVVESELGEVLHRMLHSEAGQAALAVSEARSKKAHAEFLLMQAEERLAKALQKPTDLAGGL